MSFGTDHIDDSFEAGIDKLKDEDKANRGDQDKPFIGGEVKHHGDDDSKCADKKVNAKIRFVFNCRFNALKSIAEALGNGSYSTHVIL